MKKTFLDTNIIVYANDARDPVKQSRAIDRVTELLQSGTGVVSTQVLQEYAVVALGKLGQNLNAVLHQLLMLESLEVVEITPTLVRRGLEIHAHYQISYWDAAIIAAAEHAKCSLLLSEDLSPARFYATVQVENPFSETPPAPR